MILHLHKTNYFSVISNIQSIPIPFVHLLERPGLLLLLLGVAVLSLVHLDGVVQDRFHSEAITGYNKLTG